MTAPTTRHTLFLNVIIVIVSIICALGLGEVVVRMKNADMKTYDIEMWRYAKELKTRSSDPLLGHEHIKNASAILQSTEIRTNEYGLRGGPVEPLSADGRRVLFLGASILLGWGVPEDKVVTSLLEKDLRVIDPTVQVLNAGIGNYNAERYVHLFMTRLKELNPTDIVVLYFLRDAEHLDAGGGNWLLRNSELAMTLWIAATHIKARFGEQSLVDHYRDVYKDDAQGFKEMQKSLADLASYAKERGIRLYLAIVPDVHNLKDYQLGFAHEKTAALANSLGYKTIDLLPFFGNLNPEKIWAMPGDPHPNALGHKIMADALLSLLLADTKTSSQH